MLYYSIPARLYFLTNVTRLINRVYFYQFFVRASHSVYMYISDAEFDAYYTGVKIDRFNVKIQLYKNRTLIPLIVHVQLIKILFCLIEAPRFFSMLNRFKKNIKYILKRIYILTFHLLILVIIEHLHL